MTRVEPGSGSNGARTGRPVRGDRAIDRVGDRFSERVGDRVSDRTVDRSRSTGYSHRGTGRSIDDVRGRGREALAATRGATALTLSPAVEPVRRRRPGRPDVAPPVRDAEPEHGDLPSDRRAGAADGADRSADRGTARRADRGAERDASGAGVRRAGLVDRFGTPGQRARRSAPAASPSGDAGARAAISVVPPLPVSAPRAPFVALVLSVVVVGVLGILVINTKINEGAFHLHDLRAQQGNLDQHEQRLQREIAEKESPGNLAAAARQLGLVRADSPAFLTLPDGRQLGVPKPAAGPASVAGQPTG